MDLVADVLRQADVTKLKLATSKLIGLKDFIPGKINNSEFRKISNHYANKDLSSVVAADFAKDQSRVPGNGSKISNTKPENISKKAAMRGLEDVLATKMVEAMMPKDQVKLYGDGTAGEIWRGFHIETMGKALASQGLFATAADRGGQTGLDTEKKLRTKMIVPFAG
jgi:hypothetical protein